MIVLIGQATAGKSHSSLLAGSVHEVVAVVAGDNLAHARELLMSELAVAGFSNFIGRKSVELPSTVVGLTAEEEAMFQDVAKRGIHIIVRLDDEQPS